MCLRMLRLILIPINNGFNVAFTINRQWLFDYLVKNPMITFKL